MELDKLILVVIGGAFGAVLRYVVGLNVASWLGVPCYWVTMLINVCGSFLMGIAMTQMEMSSWRLLLTTGCLGGFTTFSTFSFESISLLQEGLTLTFVGYVSGSVFLGLLAAYLGTKFF